MDLLKKFNEKVLRDLRDRSNAWRTYDVLNNVAAIIETDDHLEAGMDPNWLINKANEILLPGALRGDVFKISCDVVTDRYGY